MKDAHPRVTRLSEYRPPAFLVDTADLRFELGEDATLVHGRLALRRNAATDAPDAPLALNGQGLVLESIAIDGKALAAGDYRYEDDLLHIPSVPGHFVLETTVRIEPQKNTALEGLYRSRGMFCTQCEPEGFRRITFFPDRPDVLARFSTEIIAPRAGFPVLLSNGNETARGELPDGRHWVRWEDPFPKPSYLFALVAGDLVSLDDRFVTCSGRDVALRIFVEPKDLDKCAFGMEALKQSMRWDEEVYGREYDLDVFMIVAVDDFNMGAMENKGLNVFNTSCVLAHKDITTDAGFLRIAGIVAHEYFHNWSGNRVTCRDWFQLSLKEGFTVFRDAQFSADTGASVVRRIENVALLRTAQFAEDGGPMAHPVRPDSYLEINNFYTLTVYEKGAELVRMIRELVGPEAFRRGSDLYFARHDGQAVTTEDFVRAMEDASGRDLGQFRLWYTQAGTPHLTFRDAWDAATGCYRLEVTQTCPPTPGQPHKEPMHIPVRLGLIGSNGEIPFAQGGPLDTEHVLELREPVSEFVFTGIPEHPVPSLLRGFSAPVKASFDYSSEDLERLMRLDSDGFARWDAGQTLALRVLQARMAGHGGDGADERLASAFRALLREVSADPATVAQMLVLPAETYLGELAGIIDPLAIHAARQAERRALARELKAEFLACYERLLSEAEYRVDPVQVGRRSLRNACAHYLSLLGDGACRSLLRRQYHDASNMTDRLAALTALVQGDPDPASSGADVLLADFQAHWRHEALALNLWFTVQAQRPHAEALDDVRALLQHRDFELRNPNRVRALIGAFCSGNAPGFHRADSAGYRFLCEQVSALDPVNPQVAARLLAPLTRWRRHAPGHAEGMRSALETLRNLPGLSPDCFEVVDKSLAAPPAEAG
jgi:aminopeptidase N